MKVPAFGIALLTGAVAVGCGDDNNNNPPQVQPDNSCLSVIDPPAGGFMPPTPDKGDYECPGYHENAYPATIRDWHTTTTYHEDGPIPGCNGSTHLDWPSCSIVAEASGPIFFPEHHGDNDYNMQLCPEPGFEKVFPAGVGGMAMPMELRNQSNFRTDEIKELGAMDIEVQDCLFYRGSYTPPGGKAIQVKPEDGDEVAAYGEWIADDGHHRDEAHAEIHEATALAVVKPFDPTTKLLFASGFFVNRDVHANLNAMQLDAHVMPPSATATLTACDPAPDLDGKQSPPCTAQPGITVTPSVGPGSTCELQFDRDPATAPPLLPFGCNGNSSQQCEGAQFSMGSCPANVQFAGAFRATFDPPSDLWLCHCQAPDPSTPGATITVPMQGCSSTSADPASACADVCGQMGQVCDSLAEPGCTIGDTQAAVPGFGRITGPESCDPTKKPLPEHVSPAGDYKAELTGSARIQAPHIDVTRPATMELFFDLVQAKGAVSAIDISDASGSTPDFDISGHQVSHVQIFIGTRQVGSFDDPAYPTRFRVPIGLGVYGVRAEVDGKLQGLNVTNPAGFEISGTVDLESRRFTLHIHGSDPQTDETRLLTADLSGRIVNRPPRADASRTPTRPECSSHTLTPIALDGTASSDPDGDPIAHYQWFRLDHGTPVSFGAGNVAVAHTALPLGVPTDFELHVYDPKLGAGETTRRVTVVDTTPPSLHVTPAALCEWPPDHRRVRFELGRDIRAQVSDVCDPHPTVRIVAVVSSEPDNGLGDGDRAHDVSFGPDTLCVRRERSGAGNGRVYTVVIEARDHSGNATRRLVTITVPHDQPQGCRPSGEVITDTAPCDPDAPESIPPPAPTP